jgi:hypothetical protein
MPRRFTGFGALGNSLPESRSAFINLKRAMRGLSGAQRSQGLSNETEVARSFSAKSVGGRSRGGRPTVTTFGRDADKPPANFLAKRGVGSLVYVATDTNKVYIWNGTTYKSSTFA